MKNFWLQKAEIKQKEILIESMIKVFEEAMNKCIFGKTATTVKLEGETIVANITFCNSTPIEHIYIELTVS